MSLREADPRAPDPDPERPITPAWRADIMARMGKLNMSFRDLAREIGTSQQAIAYVLTRAGSSVFVTRIENAVVGREASSAPRIQRYDPDPDLVAVIAALTESRDAIVADIVRLETARAAVDDRMAEAHEHRARLDARIRELRGRRLHPILPAATTNQGAQ